MRAITQERYGGPEVLVEREIADPVPREGELLVRVHAAGVDSGVLRRMAGTPLLARLATGLRRPRARVPGFDFSGTVIDAGGSGFSSGEQVFGTTEGAFAEYVTARPALVVRKPAHLGFAETAALPSAGMTALRALRIAGRVREEQRVLIVGADTQIGSLGAQIARDSGAIVTSMPGSADLGSVATDLEYWDLVVEVSGDRTLHALRGAATTRGAVVLIAGIGGGRLLGSASRSLAASVLSPVTRQRLVTSASSPRSADLETLRAMVNDGALTPIVERRFPLSRIADAVTDPVAANGSIVLEVLSD